MSNLQESAPFPDFSLGAVRPQESGAHTFTLSNADLRGRPCVLFFYPKDATCGCTVEVCSFRDRYSEFQKLGVEVVGVSRDTLSSHQKFIANQNLPFPLLSDKERELARACGLLVNKTMYGKPVVGSMRATFALDENGVVQHIWRDVQPLGHADAVLQWCREHVEPRMAANEHE